MEKELEISPEKVYNLPEFQVVRHKKVWLAIATDIARWLVLQNASQLAILELLIGKNTVGDILKCNQIKESDLFAVLVQLEALQIETLHPPTIFSNTRLHLHLTNKCNLRCPHCYLNSGDVCENELSTDEIKKLIHDFKSIGGTTVSLTGGEPLLRNDFIEIVEEISSTDMNCSIFSNGLCLNEGMVDRLAKCKIDGVQISIDGFDEQSNAIIRGKSAFKKALNAIDLLVRNKVHVKVAVTPLLSMIKGHKSEYVAFAKELIGKYGQDLVEINFSHFLMPGRNLGEDEIKEFKDDYFSVVSEVLSAVYPDAEEDSFVVNIRNHIFDSCGYGGLIVMANGDFLFCDRVADVARRGNIRDFTFPEIFELMKQAELAGKIDNFKPCKECALKYICGGGCRAEHFRQFTQMADVSLIDFEKIPPRQCDQKHKDKIYDLMVKTLERFYR